MKTLITTLILILIAAVGYGQISPLKVSHDKRNNDTIHYDDDLLRLADLPNPLSLHATGFVYTNMRDKQIIMRINQSMNRRTYTVTFSPKQVKFINDSTFTFTITP